jgi:hypothetical protein
METVQGGGYPSIRHDLHGTGCPSRSQARARWTQEIAGFGNGRCTGSTMKIDLLLAALDKLAEAISLLRESIRENGGDLPGEIIEPVDEPFLDRKIKTINFGGSTTRVHWMCENGWLVDGYSRMQGKPVETVRDLIAFKESDLLRVSNVGRLTVDRVKTVLAAHGLKLRTPPPWVDPNEGEVP